MATHKTPVGITKDYKRRRREGHAFAIPRARHPKLREAAKAFARPDGGDSSWFIPAGAAHLGIDRSDVERIGATTTGHEATIPGAYIPFFRVIRPQ